MVDLSKIFGKRGNVKGACKLAARAAEIAPNDPDVACALAAAVCMHVCMYVCMYVFHGGGIYCICMFVYVCMHACLHLHVCVCGCTYIYVCVCETCRKLDNAQACP